MSLSLKPMTESEFALFQEKSQKVYVGQSMANTGLTREEAERRAAEEEKKALPEGLATKNALLLSIFLAGERIGYFWFGLRQKDGSLTAFTYAFEIFEPWKGHGYLAMVKARGALRAAGVKKVSLHVFSTNERAIALYEAVGFRTTSRNMSAEL